MTVASTASERTKRLFKLTLSVLRLGFNSSKCKTAAKMAVARIKLLKNKREVVVRQMRRDIALLLQSGQDGTARIRVEHVMREQNVLAANEFIELFCELVVARLSIIAKQRECPADLKEGIASLIFAAPRCSEIPELVALKNIFEKKYGKDFVSAAVDLRPSCGVNRQLIEKLSVRTPPGEVKLKVLKEIAKEHQIDWDTTESEQELLKPPEELIEGPRAFVSASTLPVKPSTNVSIESNKPATRLSGGGMHYEDSKAAAEAAAEAAKKAIAAAEVAAYMAMKDNNEAPQPYIYNNKLYNSGVNSVTFQSHNPPKCTHNPMSTEEKMNMSHGLPRSDLMNNEDTLPNQYGGNDYRRHSYHPRSDQMNNEDTLPNQYGGNDYRRHSYHPTSAYSDIKFDESDCDEEIEAEEPPATVPPNRLPPPVPSSLAKQDNRIRVHPKLPDYDELAARFDALKFKK
ncbi:IST1-like protein [Cajanus cajan]|uniref:IST1-like protein n=1 Tax=Cajanus cajan TaxID=3821 RepID=UPI00098DA14E|nr:IST1-like protein [Cajanus cajan]